MANQRPEAVFGDLRRLFGEGTVAGLDDAQLLERFVAGRDEAAFAALLTVHGPMVMAVCRRVLSDSDDIEDAFQATFLALVRKARSVRAEGSLGGWLHRVAYRVAVEANRDAIRRRAREALAAVRSAADRNGDLLPDDFRPALHEELARLPEKFRRPVVLCYLEGKTQEEAAVALRWSGATLRRRLAGARERLRVRLAQRGIAPPAALLAAALAHEVTASVPPELASATIRAASALVLGRSAIPSAALTLSRRLLRSLLMTRLRTLAMVSLSTGAIAWLAIGLAAAQHGGASGTGPEPAHAADAAAPKQDGPPPGGDAARDIVVAAVQSKTVTLTQSYACRIESHHHIEVRAPVSGYLEAITIKEGQVVKKGDLLFKFFPVIYQARLDAESADLQIAQLEMNNAEKLFEKKAVSEDEVRLQEAKLAKAKAKAQLAKAELDFMSVKAPFDGMIGRLPLQRGSLVREGESLTSLFDNSAVRAYFNVPEAVYLEYIDGQGRQKQEGQLELVLANGRKFQHPGKMAAIEAKFNAGTGSIPFRADFPNPERQLRDGQTGTLSIGRMEDGAIVIPQRAAFEDSDKRHTYVVDGEGIAHRREIAIRAEVDGLFVIKRGLAVGDKIVVEGVGLIHDGDKVKQ